MDSLDLAMVDAWRAAIAAMWGPHVAPAVRWPADRTIIVSAGDDAEAIDSAHVTEGEAAVLEALRAGAIRVHELAELTHSSATSISVRLHRMRRKGLARPVARGQWAASPLP